MQIKIDAPSGGAGTELLVLTESADLRDQWITAIRGVQALVNKGEASARPYSQNSIVDSIGCNEVKRSTYSR